MTVVADAPLSIALHRILEVLLGLRLPLDIATGGIRWLVDGQRQGLGFVPLLLLLVANHWCSAMTWFAIPGQSLVVPLITSRPTASTLSGGGTQVDALIAAVFGERGGVQRDQFLLTGVSSWWLGTTLRRAGFMRLVTISLGLLQE